MMEITAELRLIFIFIVFSQFVMKRQITIRKALGDIAAATKLLVEYLKIYLADSDAWAELADLYLAQNMYGRVKRKSACFLKLFPCFSFFFDRLKNACFCYEELIVHNPRNPHVFTKYAEILYTIGGAENFKLARTLFSFALDLDKNNLKALYGVYMVRRMDCVVIFVIFLLLVFVAECIGITIAKAFETRCEQLHDIDGSGTHAYDNLQD
jgi:tetratricopeptide (TPR) repeat protein